MLKVFLKLKEKRNVLGHKSLMTEQKIMAAQWTMSGHDGPLSGQIRPGLLTGHIEWSDVGPSPVIISGD